MAKQPAAGKSETSVTGRAQVKLVSKFQNSPDCYEVFVSRRRVAFVFVPDGNIVWLPGKECGLSLNTKEKIALAEWIPSQLQELTAEEDADEARLAQLSAGRQA